MLDVLALIISCLAVTISVLVALRKDEMFYPKPPPEEWTKSVDEGIGETVWHHETLASGCRFDHMRDGSVDVYNPDGSYIGRAGDRNEALAMVPG